MSNEIANQDVVNIDLKGIDLLEDKLKTARINGDTVVKNLLTTLKGDLVLNSRGRNNAAPIPYTDESLSDLSKSFRKSVLAVNNEDTATEVAILDLFILPSTGPSTEEMTEVLITLLASEPDAVAQYKSGNKGALGKLIGKGKSLFTTPVDGNDVKSILETLLNTPE